MKFSDVTRILRLGTPPAVLSPQRAVLLDYAYACPDCGWVLQGALNHKCKECESDRIVHVATLMDTVRKKADQKQKIDDITNDAQQRREHNDMTFLTDFREPDEAA